MQILALEQGGKTIVLDPQPFDLEVGLQELLERYPTLMLAASEFDERQIWTIGYEVGTAAGAVDLLMLDSSGEVWIIETKLRKNPEVKKQVVGQVLGYASCVAAWSVDKLEAVALEYLNSRGGMQVESLVEHLATDVGLEQAEKIVLRSVEKLHQGDLTSVVVVDELPSTLRRLVEFVNDHASFDLLAMQVEVIEHQGTRFVIPVVTGTSTKRVSPTGRTEASYEEMVESAGDAFREVSQRLDGLASQRSWRPVQQPRSLKYVTSDGIFVFRLYPQWNSIQLWLSSLYEADLAAEAGAIRTDVSAITSKPAPEKGIAIQADAAISHWDKFVALLDRYVDARTRAVTQVGAAVDMQSDGF